MAIFLNALVFMVQLTDLEAKLSVIEANPDHVHWKGFCGVSPVVLGVWVVDEDIDTEIFQHDGLPRPFTVPRQTPHSLQFDHGVFIIIIIRNFNSKGNCQHLDDGREAAKPLPAAPDCLLPWLSVSAQL